MICSHSTQESLQMPCLTVDTLSNILVLVNEKYLTGIFLCSIMDYCKAKILDACLVMNVSLVGIYGEV
jgi:hypothetical protein